MSCKSPAPVGEIKRQTVTKTGFLHTWRSDKTAAGGDKKLVTPAIVAHSVIISNAGRIPPKAWFQSV